MLTYVISGRFTILKSFSMASLALFNRLFEGGPFSFPLFQSSSFLKPCPFFLKWWNEACQWTLKLTGSIAPSNGSTASAWCVRTLTLSFALLFAVLYVISGNERVSPSHEPRNFGISTRSQNFAIYALYIYIYIYIYTYFPQKKSTNWRSTNTTVLGKMKVSTPSDPETQNRSYPHLLKLPG